LGAGVKRGRPGEKPTGQAEGDGMMTGNDISWSMPGETFNLRVAAVIIRHRKVLLCTVDGLEYWFLPGGRVRFGEPAQLALSRELAEELGHQFPAGRLALVVENIYRDSSLQHEIGFYYRLAWPPGLAHGDLDGGTEPGHRFRWTAISELNSVRFEPTGLVPELQELGDDVRHVLLDRRHEGR
jgi:ADP-ribose pyrophosphatase YjhB (NUDIX family)